MAEYNSACLSLLKRKFLGASKDKKKAVKTYLEENGDKLRETIGKREIWSLSEYDNPVNWIFEGNVYITICEMTNRNG